MKKIKKRSDCPVSSALDIIGDKWSLLIVRDMALSGKNTYNELLKSDEKIATNILADRLCMLENSGIIVSEEHPDSKAKILYRLTQQGIDLLPILIEMILWSTKHLNITKEEKDKAKMFRKNKEEIIKQISSGLKKK